MLSHLPQFFKDPIASVTGLVFSSVGVLFGTWAAFIPYLKNKFELNEAELGLILLTLPLGAACMNPLCIPLIRKLGTATATILSLLATALFLIIPINMPHVWLLALSLFIYGMAFSAINITMNTCASQLELHTGKNIIATCHGLWSGGAMIGSAAAGLGQGWGFTPPLYVIGTAFFVAGIAVLVRPVLARLPDDYHEGSTVKTSKAFIKPNKALWILIVIGLCVNLGEGTMADWATVYVKEVMHTPSSVASWGFSTYAFFMMTGRLLGDGLIGEFGTKNVLKGCGILLTIGYVIAVFAPAVWVLFIGLAFIGLGISLGSPILYAASSRVPGLPKGAGLAIYNTYAMVGFLGGPVIIGFIARAYSLPIAFSVVAFFGLIWVLLTRKMP